MAEWSGIAAEWSDIVEWQSGVAEWRDIVEWRSGRVNRPSSVIAHLHNSIYYVTL